MRMPGTLAAAVALGVVAAGCQPAADGRSAGSAQQFSAIGRGDIIHLVGTEPFWGGTLDGATLTYTTPEDARGEAIAVKRFAGNNGLGFSGSLRGQPLDLAITPASCSDGMSDRTYPYAATLRIGGEQRSGCAWTDTTPPAGTPGPRAGPGSGP